LGEKKGLAYFVPDDLNQTMLFLLQLRGYQLPLAYTPFKFAYVHLSDRRMSSTFVFLVGLCYFHFFFFAFLQYESYFNVLLLTCWNLVQRLLNEFIEGEC